MFVVFANMRHCLIWCLLYLLNMRHCLILCLLYLLYRRQWECKCSLHRDLGDHSTTRCTKTKSYKFASGVDDPNSRSAVFAHLKRWALAGWQCTHRTGPEGHQTVTISHGLTLASVEELDQVRETFEAADARAQPLREDRRSKASRAVAQGVRATSSSQACAAPARRESPERSSSGSSSTSSSGSSSSSANGSSDGEEHVL